MDGQSAGDIEAYGVERWLGELAKELKEGTCRPEAVRQVLIPRKERGKYKPLGILCYRNRVAQTAAMLVLVPIFEVDLEPEQYAYRSGRSARKTCALVAQRGMEGRSGRGFVELFWRDTA